MFKLDERFKIIKSVQNCLSNADGKLRLDSSLLIPVRT